jgi:DNA-binding response OmpR family regulator
MPKAKILVVDDNPFICRLLESRLRASEYDVIGALDGGEALEKAQKEKPDLILLDINMPGIDGFEIGAKLRANNQTSSIPIIMVTALGEHQNIVKAMTELDAASYVVKPFKPEKLLEEVRKVLEKKGK